MRGRSGLLVALAALVAAAPARAGVAAVSPFAPLQAGPALAGDHVVVWDDAAGDLRSALFAEGPGTRLRPPDDGLGPGERTTTLVAASTTRVAYLQDVQEFGPRPGQDDFDPNHLGTVLGAGPAAGPPAIVARRRGRGPGAPSPGPRQPGGGAPQPAAGALAGGGAGARAGARVRRA
ncbi:MAG: hypothetical protein ACXVFT_17285 [Solirubrobacteraceae bacterium]